MATLDEMKADYDWCEAFNFAAFNLEEVAEVVASDEGENDGDSWLAVGRLNDGSYFFLSAWCDYTGWDCRSGGGSELADSLENLVRFVLADEDRARLGYTLPPETDGAPLPVTDPQP